MSTQLSGQRQAVHPYRNVKLLLSILLLAATGAAAYYWWSTSHAKPKYVTADISQGDIDRSVNVTGSINPRVTVQVGSYVSGTVKSLSCDFNTEVKAGQVCAKIDPSTFQVVVDQNAAQLNSSRAQLHKDESALVYAKAVFERDTKLLKDGIVAQEIVDNDKNLFKQASAQIDLDKAAIVAQEASLKSAMVNLGYTNIVSPVTGTVLTRNVDVGQTVASSLQTPTLFLIGKDLTKMQVDANVSEADVGRIKVGQNVTFSVQAYPDKEFDGTVKQIRRGPITVQNVVTYDVVVSVDNPELLLFPGMTADAEIVTDARENVLRVPLAATRFTPEQNGHNGHGGDAARADAGNHAEERNVKHNEKHASDQQEEKSATPTPENPDAKLAVADKTATPAMASTPDDKHQANEQATEHVQHRGEGHWQHQGEHAGDDSDEHHNWKREHGGEHHGEHGRGGHEHSAPTTQEQISDKPVAQDEKADIAANKAQSTETEKHVEQPKKRARVWVLRDGVPRPIWIITGLDDGDVVEVLGGELKPGDKVIVNEIRPVEAKSASVQLPFSPQGGKRGGMGRP